MVGIPLMAGWSRVAAGEPAAPIDRFALEEPVVHGDGVVRGTAVTLEDVVIGETEGTITLRACCGLEDLATCPDTSTYEIGWALDRDPGVLFRGDAVGVTLSNVRTSGSCSEIDPTVVVAGDNGNPADSLPALGVTFPGPVGLFDDTLAGGRYYPTNGDPHTDHDDSLRTVSVRDADTLLDDGYFHLDVAHRWGLQYEVVWVYHRSEATGDTGDPDGGGSGRVRRCETASGSSGAAALAALALVARIRRRSARRG